MVPNAGCGNRDFCHLNPNHGFHPGSSFFGKRKAGSGCNNNLGALKDTLRQIERWSTIHRVAEEFALRRIESVARISSSLSAFLLQRSSRSGALKVANDIFKEHGACAPF